MSDFNIETVAIDSLRPHPRNYRAHPQAQIEHLEASLREYGWARNVVVASDGVILAGHGVVEAARRRGETTVPVHRLALKSSDPKAEKFMVLENEVSRLAQDDDGQLAALLADIQRTEGLDGTGWDDHGLDDLIGQIAADGQVPNYDPVSIDEQGRLDQLEPKWMQCPNCGERFDAREADEA